MVNLTVLWGAIGSVAFTAVVLLSWRLTPQVWIGDVTNGEQRPDVNIANITWFLLVTVSFVGGGFVAAWLASSRHDASFVQAALVAFAVMAIVNLVDLVIVDIAVFLWLRPSFMTLPGIEMPTDYGMHVRGAVNGLVMAIPISALAALVALTA
ncbi:MAG: hypothetical protein AAFP84_19590 [Actinomycetota bacterium]